MTLDYFIFNYGKSYSVTMLEDEARRVLSLKQRATFKDALNWPLKMVVKGARGFYRCYASPCNEFVYWVTPSGFTYDIKKDK